MGINIENFGFTSNEEEATLYTITNKSGMKMAVTDYGAALV